MSEWREVKLGEVSEITSSKRIFYSDYVSAGIPFWRSKEVIEKFNRKEISTDLFITPEKYSEIKNRFGVPQQNDILLTSVGTLGIPYLVEDNEHFYFKDGNLTWIRNIDEQRLSPRYLYKWLASQQGRDSLREITIGSTQEALTILGLKSLNLLLPPLPEQKAIAAVLSSFDDKIDLLHRQNQILEAMAAILFRQWFVEEAQEDWDEVALEDVTSRITDGAHASPPTVDVGLPMASVKDMYQWGINTASCRQISQDDFDELVRTDCRPLKNDILIAKDGSYLKHVFVAEDDMDVVILSSIAILRPNGKYHPLLLATFLKLESTREGLENIVTGAVIPRIVLKDFRKYKLLLPPKQRQDQAIAIIQPIYEKCWENDRQIRTLEKLRDNLLPKLMSGEVRVAA